MVADLDAIGAWWISALWDVSVQACLLILVIALVASACRRTSPGFRYALWCVVLVRLCLPFGLSTPLGVEDRLNGAVLHAVVRVQPDLTALSGRSSAEGPLPLRGRSIRTDEASVNQETATKVTRVAAILWLVLAGLMGAIVLRHMDRRRNTLADTESVKREEILELVDRLRAELGMRRRVEVCTEERSHSSAPFLTGLLTPRIVLPFRMIRQWSLDEIEPVLLHELAHVKRHDLFVNALQIVIQIVYFFHPLVWFANWRIRQLREEACDDAAIGYLRGERKRYGSSFLRVIEETHRESRRAVAQVGLAELRNSLGRRVVRIMSKEYTHHRKLGLGAVVVLILIGVAATCVTSGSAGDKSGQQSLFDEAEKLYEAKEYAEALEVYRQVHKKYPASKNAEHASMMVGVCYDWMGEQDKELEAYKAAVAKYPRSSGTYFYLGLAYHQSGADENALEAFRKCIELCQGSKRPDEFPYLDARGWEKLIPAETLYESKRYDEAIEVYRQVRDECPTWDNTEHALMMVGICYEKIGEQDKAMAAYETAVAEHPDLAGWSEASYFYLASLYEQAGRTDDALQAYERCVSLCEKASGRVANAFPWREAAERIAELN